MSNKTPSPKNTRSIENKLKKIDETLIEIRKEEGKVRMEIQRLIVKLERKIEILKVERDRKLERLKVEREELNKKKKKLLTKEVSVLNREVKKRKITNQFGKGFTSPSRSTFIQKNNISNK